MAILLPGANEKVFLCQLTKRNGGRVHAPQKKRADSLGMQQARLHRWKQSLPHCHRRCTSPLRAVDCHRLAQRETVFTQSHMCRNSLSLALLCNNVGKFTKKLVSTKLNPQGDTITDVNVAISPKK